ncbi:ABC transporter ATP-binding protein [Gordonia sp. NB41Y]|uniref:ABC transporter ATP-binding protein n=1 Tax=Gordonia sp. NB41Y TaxID=875808 RepID=UPI0006B1CF7E|nr:ABC transporter ATP-binding protein [Gordonia sp. NB41Y]KOY50071.1 hypothetical protein ISGA_06035 [Gordonia sp. NB41Y]WLP88429.1 ABC transporter ATP-binding protein [Gordonia sp. NB41Y]
MTEPVSNSPLLKVTDLGVRYRGSAQAALADVSFTVDAGEFVAIIGESGSGKSTLAATLLGLLPSDAEVSGSVQLDSREVVGLADKQFQTLRGVDVALVPQDPAASLDPLVSVARQISEVLVRGGLTGRARASERRATAIELLERVGVDRPESRLAQYPHELSGGLKQRILIAMAFALRPKLLIADEPTSALDVTVQKRVMDVFSDLAASTSTAIVLITHDVALATDYSSRSIVVYRGRLIEDSTVETLIGGATEPYTQTLMRSVTEDRTHIGEAGAGVDSEIAIYAESLTKTYQERSRQGLISALTDATVTVHHGQTVALVGESGSGKTTLGRIMVGLISPDSGTVRVGGELVDPSNRRSLRKTWSHIQYVHQNPWLSLDPRLSVDKSLREPLRAAGFRGNADERIAEVLSWVALPSDLLRSRPAQLSGGQRQRVVLARTLLTGARILVLDEVLSALDVVTQEQIIGLLDDLQRRLGLTYVFISHDLATVRAVADRVIVLRHGSIVENGTTAEIFNNPEQLYTRELLDAIPGSRIRRAALAVGGSSTFDTTER